jgi:hypothetical protein
MSGASDSSVRVNIRIKNKLHSSVNSVSIDYGLDGRGIGVRFPTEVGIVLFYTEPRCALAPPSLLCKLYGGFTADVASLLHHLSFHDVVLN